MTLKKPTITECVDGKEHAWLIVSEEKDEQNHVWEHRWCQKCGALTQVIFNSDGVPVAVMNEDKTPFVMVPKVLAAVIR
jgi:hypothetical protein